MYFKKSGLFVFLFLFILSCASENEPQPETISINLSKSKDLSCLDNFRAHVEKYFAGLTQEKEVRDFWKCTSTAVRVFQDFSPKSYKEKGEFPILGVKRFLEAYFWQGEVPEEFLSEVMGLKVVLLGGSQFQFTIVELQALEAFLVEDMGEMLVKLRPDITLLVSGIMGPKKPNITETQMDSAIDKFKRAMYRFGEVFSRKSKNYSFDRLNALLKQVEPLFTSDNKNSYFKNIKSLTPALQESKVLLVGPDRNQILSQEWPSFFEMIANIYSIWLRSTNFIAGKDLTEGSAFSQFATLADEVLTYIKFGLSKRLIPVYEDEEAKRLLVAMSNVSGLPFGLSIDTALSAWSIFTNKLLNPRDGIAQTSRNEPGLTLNKVRFLQDEFRDWFNVQKVVNQVAGVEFNPEDERLGKFKRVFRGLKTSLDFDSLGRLKVPFLKSGYSRDALKMLNLERKLVEIVINAYATDNERLQLVKALSLPELGVFVDDVKPVLVALDLIEPNDQNFAKRVYRDTSLFLPRSNGDEWIDFEEAIEYVHFIISGLNANKVLKSTAQKFCPNEIDFDNNKLGRTCFFEMQEAKSRDLFAHLPLLGNFLNSKAGTKDWAQFTQNLWKSVADIGDDNSDHLLFGELFEMQVLMTYVEMFIYRFDLNKDHILSPREIKSFMDAFVGPIGLISGFDPKVHGGKIRAIFSYILKFSKSPFDPHDKGASLRFSYWEKVPEHWDYAADRLDLSFVLSVLAKM